MNKLILSIAVLAALTACSKEEAKKSNDEVIKETISSDDFKNLDKDAQAIVLRALSDKEGTGSTPEVANNDTSGNVDDTELTPEEQAMDDGSGLTTEDNGALDIAATADLEKNTIGVKFRDGYDSSSSPSVLRNPRMFAHSTDMSNKNFISGWYNGLYDNMYLGRISDVEIRAEYTVPTPEVPEVNGKVNTTKPILVSSIPKLTVGDGKIFNKHPCNFF